MRTLLEYREHLSGYKLSGFASFMDDAEQIEALNSELQLLDSSYTRLLEDCDAVVLIDNYRGFRPDKYYRVIEDAIRASKEILVTSLAFSQLDLVDYVGQYSLLEFQPKEAVSAGLDGADNKKKLMNIDIPIIGVLGQGYHCGKFRTQLLLKSVLDKEYNTVAITSNSLGALFKCFTLPSLMFADGSFERKVIELNRYIKAISTIGNPDVLVLGVPEGIAPFRSTEFHHFAEYPLILSSATTFDLAVLCTYFVTGSRLKTGLLNMAKYCANRFEIPIEAFSISSTLFEIPQEEDGSMIYEFLDDIFISEHYPDIENVNLPMLDPFNRDSATAVIEVLIERLKGNISSVY